MVEMPWLLIAFLAVERGLWGTWASGAAVRELSGRGTRAKMLCSTWHLPRPGIEPMSHASVDGFSSTGPPGNSLVQWFRKLSPTSFPIWPPERTEDVSSGSGRPQKATFLSLLFFTSGRDLRMRLRVPQDTDARGPTRGSSVDSIS